MPNYNAELRDLDSTANEFTLKCLRFTVIAFAFVWLLTMINVFIVDKILMTVVFVVSSVIMLLPSLICRFVGAKRRWVKYMILFSITLAATLIGCALSFHSVLMFALPLIFASQYSKRKVIYYTYGLIVIGIFISVMGSYFFGVADANMIILTNNSTDFYIDPQTGHLNDVPVNPNPWLTLPRYFVLPRCLILLVFVPVISNISKNIADTAVRTANLVHESETDKMTHFYNKGKYEQMLKSYYPDLSTVAVIFWDVNNLKNTNDTYGHIYGDFLITSIADIIRSRTDDTHKTYRVGGDEFVMIVENPAPGEAEMIAEQCNELIAARNKSSNFPISVSVGYSVGPGSRITTLIHEADSLMYAAKKASKMTRG